MDNSRTGIDVHYGRCWPSGTRSRARGRRCLGAPAQIDARGDLELMSLDLADEADTKTVVTVAIVLRVRKALAETDVVRV